MNKVFKEQAINRTLFKWLDSRKQMLYEAGECHETDKQCNEIREAIRTPGHYLRHRVVNQRLEERRKKKAKKKKRRRQYKDSDSFYASQEWRELRYQALRNSEGKCNLCGGTADDGIRLHVDHVMPRSKFPHLELDLGNLQVLCEDCNMGKSNYYNDDWRPQ